MRRRHARRQVGKERRAFGGDAEPDVNRAHAVEVLGARLLHDRKRARSQRVRRSTADGTISDMTCAPWLPPNTKSASGRPAAGAA